MSRFTSLFILLFVIAAADVAGAPAGGAMRPPTQEEKDFYIKVVQPAIATVKKAMPPVPQGWAIESETPIAAALPDLVTDDASRLWFTYTISYKRVANVESERKKLDEAVVEAKKNFEGAAKARADELTAKRAAAEEAMKRAVKKKSAAEERQLKKEIEDISVKLNAIPEETERAILAETEEFLVRDTGFTLRFTVNATTASYPDARYFSRPKAAYALKKEGGRVGLTGWKQDQVMLLYGDWSDGGKDNFIGKVEQRPFSSRVRTIAIMIECDPSRLDQVLKQMGMRDILGMLR